MPTRTTFDSIFLKENETDEITRIRIDEITLWEDPNSKDVEIKGVILATQKKVAFTIDKEEIIESMAWCADFEDVFEDERGRRRDSIDYSPINTKLMSFRWQVLSVVIKVSTRRAISGFSLSEIDY